MLKVREPLGDSVEFGEAEVLELGERLLTGDDSDWRGSVEFA